MKAQSKFVGTN